MEALYRLQGELLALGLEVEITERPALRELDAPALDDSLTRMASDRELDAIIDVVGDSTPRAVEIWIIGGAPRRARLSRVVLEPSTPDPAETLAIRAIEVLRANFVEIDLAART